MNDGSYPSTSSVANKRPPRGGKTATGSGSEDRGVLPLLQLIFVESAEEPREKIVRNAEEARAVETKYTRM